MWLLAALARIQPAAESQAEDVSCLRRVADRDQAAAARLYDRHSREVFAQASRYDASRGTVAAWLLVMGRSRANRSPHTGARGRY